MKIYIMVDFEGASGMIEWDDYAWDTPMGQEKRRRLREFLTDEVNAAATACFESGAREVLIWDSHGPRNNCNTLYLERLHPEAQVIQGWKGLPHFYPMLDQSFNAAMYIGLHAMADSSQAILPHTRFKLNGHDVGEGGMFLAMCSYFQVPVVFVSGDAAAIQQILPFAPAMRHVETKWSFGPYAARLRVPAKSCALIREGVRDALAHRDQIAGWPLEKPYVFYDDKGNVLCSGNDLFDLFNNQILAHWRKDDQDVEPVRKAFEKHVQAERRYQYWT